MGDDDNGLAVIPHGPQNRKELFGLLGRQHGGGLIQNQDVRAPVEHLDDFHGLLLGNGHIVDLLVGIHVKAVGITDFLDLLGHLVHIQPSRLLQAQDDVLGGGEHIHQLKMLMDHTDAVGERVPGGTDQSLLPIDENFALIREVDTGEHIHQGGLAAAVFAQQGQNLSLVDVQPHPVICQGGAKAFGDVPHLYRGAFFFQKAHSFFQMPSPGGRCPRRGRMRGGTRYEFRLDPFFSRFRPLFRLA